MADPPSRAALITGSTGGLGRQIALALAREGWHVVVGGRRPGAVESVVREIVRAGGTGSAFVADLGDLDSIRRAVETTELPPFNALVLNAGITLQGHKTSGQGYELTFAVNVLAHHLLVNLLLARPGQVLQPARIVFTSSGVQIPEHKLARFFRIAVPRWVGARHLALPDQAPEEFRIPPGNQRYSTSKLGNVLQARALQCRLDAMGFRADVFAVDPGLMPDTDLAREIPRPLRWIFRGVMAVVLPFVPGMRYSTTSGEHFRSLATDGKWDGRGFAYLDGNHVVPASQDGMNDAYANALWRDASELVGLPEREPLISN